MQNNFNLDWKIRLLDSILSQGKPLDQMNVNEIRKLSETPISPIVQRILGGKRIAVAQVTQQTINGRHGEIPIQLYYPSTEPNLPLILFFHGGGWIYGNFQTHDLICRRIARDTGAVVLAVRYRLAPFFKYPIAVEDCYDVLLWAVENAVSLKVDREKLIVMGDSAGGNLATAVCLMSRDEGQSLITAQVLIYPITSGKLDQPSMERNANAPVLTKGLMECFVEYYARSESDILQPYFSPLLTPDLSNLPKALIITCNYDPLYDQAKAYAQRLQAARNEVLLLDYFGMVHGFLSFPPFCQEALPAFEKIAAYIKLVIG